MKPWQTLSSLTNSLMPPTLHRNELSASQPAFTTSRHLTSPRLQPVKASPPPSLPPAKEDSRPCRPAPMKTRIGQPERPHRSPRRRVVNNATLHTGTARTTHLPTGLKQLDPPPAPRRAACALLGGEVRTLHTARRSHMAIREDRRILREASISSPSSME